MKALQVTDVKDDERVFVLIMGVVMQSHVFGPESIDRNNGQAPVAGAKMGDHGGRFF